MNAAQEKAMSTKIEKAFDRESRILKTLLRRAEVLIDIRKAERHRPESHRDCDLCDFNYEGPEREDVIEAAAKLVGASMRLRELYEEDEVLRKTGTKKVPVK